MKEREGERVREGVKEEIERVRGGEEQRQSCWAIQINIRNAANKSQNRIYTHAHTHIYVGTYTYIC